MITDVSEENPALSRRRTEKLYLFLSASMTDKGSFSETLPLDWVTQNLPPKRESFKGTRFVEI